MAGNLNQQDKMAVYTSVDHHKQETPPRGENRKEEVPQAIPRSVQKIKSVEGQITKKKSSFQITSVVDRPDRSSSGFDSVDDLDDTCETHTEDVSSDLMDLSKTDIEPDVYSSEETTPSFINEEVPKDTVKVSHAQSKSNHVQAAPTASTPESQPLPQTQPHPQHPTPTPQPPKPIDHPSRFKVVKIESQEPFTRGRWTCLDFLDPHNAEKKVSETAHDKLERHDKVPDEVGSGNSSAASSVHYVHGVDDPSKNPLAGTLVEPQPVYPQTTPQGQPLQNGLDHQFYATTSGQIVGGASLVGGQMAGMSAGLPKEVSVQHPNQTRPGKPQVMPGHQVAAPSSHIQQGVPQRVIPNGTPHTSQSQGLPPQNVQSGHGMNLKKGSSPVLTDQTGHKQDYMQKTPGTISDFPSKDHPVHIGQSSTTSIATHAQIQPQSTAEYIASSQGDGLAHLVNTHTYTGQGISSKAPTSNTSPSTDAVHTTEMVAHTSSLIDDKLSKMPVVPTDGVLAHPDKSEVDHDHLAVKASAAQSFLSPPLLEMVSATMQAAGTARFSREEGDERSV